MLLLALFLGNSLVLSVPGSEAPPPPASLLPPEYEKSVRSMFGPAHSIDVEVRFLDTREKPARVKTMDRVLRDRQTFDKIRDILLSPTVQVQPIPPRKGHAATASWVILEFKDAAGKKLGMLTWEALDTFIFNPGGWFQADHQTGKNLIRLFVLRGEQVR